MTAYPSDPQASFRLKPIRVARVSEISESTAAAMIPDDERVNFHIGNPVQDESLSSVYLRMVLGIDIHREKLHQNDPEAILEHLGWDVTHKPKLEFLIRVIKQSAPYMPRGGYSRKKPHALVDAFRTWLEQQQEPLYYDTGEKSGKREIILGTGGIHEMVRIILFALCSYLEFTPARILSYHCDIQPLIQSIPNLLFNDLADEERVALEQIEQLLEQQSNIPTFLFIGNPLDEVTRRKLRLLSIERPLFFIEANNAPNHLSLAREAKLVQRVIRLLTPAVFAKRLHHLPTVFIAGNADFLGVIENVHFNLKGTPSASEAELLDFLLTQQLVEEGTNLSEQVPLAKPSFEGLAMGVSAETVLPDLASRTEHRLEKLVEDGVQTLAHSLTSWEEKLSLLTRRIQNAWRGHIFDELAEFKADEILDLLVQNLHNSEWIQSLQRSFLSAFIKHQPQYSAEACLVVSGSSRTALGILGFHCGVSEVVIPDLSWSYEQCFVETYTVPLSPSLGLDVDAIIEKVEQLCQHDSAWPQRGAVVINNPHNATGQIFDEDEVRRLITYCLQNNLNIIDDLAYQNVAPVQDLPEIKTVRQIAAELNRHGVINDAQVNRVISIHSMSKTDSFAGARLAVVEIGDRQIRQRFEALLSLIQPNIAAIYISYLFYRSSTQATRAYWHLRNSILFERTQALLRSVKNLPLDRNPFGLAIIPPTGSLYPLLHIESLPAGLSLDWLASALARAGIGMLPLAAFARTEDGFETGRTTFRLTLGGMDNSDTLMGKTRRLLIDLNRLIADEDSRYNRKQVSTHISERSRSHSANLFEAWNIFAKRLLETCENSRPCRRFVALISLDSSQLFQELIQAYIPERLDVFQTRLLDRAVIQDELMYRAMNDNGQWLVERLEREFMKDSLQRRQDQFRSRTYDRTVHPTQAYSLQVEMAFDEVISALISRQPIAPALIEKVAQALTKEYCGLNVAINSQQEVDEILLDLTSLISGEEFAELFTDTTLSPFLSFWSDWDGSNRPSGQGHQLVAAVAMENVRRLTRILRILQQVDPTISVNPRLKNELDLLPQRNLQFTKLLNEITQLTHQLEQRYRGILPFSVETTPLRRLATRLRIRRDPATILWQHNDRYERKMFQLRQQRRSTLEFYFALNKDLRKQLYALIPMIDNQRTSEPLLREILGYRDILQRMVLTPRINQGLITARDQFAIDTTAYNIYEINSIAGQYGNPGMTLALQISLSSKPEALISLDRKMRVQAEQMRRDLSPAELPPIWLIPLFEDIDTVRNIRSYLDQVWNYATQSRHTLQSPQDRFAEIISEIFIAGSDLSQQVSQANAAHLYRKAKYDTHSWLAEHGVVDAVRIKLGSGEPMQRQGGYYSRVAGQAAFNKSEDDKRRISKHLPAPARKSTVYAVTPLQGVFLGGDLRTFQSRLSEHLRFLPVQEYVSLQNHIREAQYSHRQDLIRASETIAESRLGAQSRSLQELERLTIGTDETLMESFLDELTDNFRHILYGCEEDVVGIHIISYFIGRSLPQLRDRPTSRRTPGTGVERGQQILANIAEIIPLAKQGSLLRAISHNQSQTVVLGINQLTTGLFRALERYARKSFAEAERERMVAERLLPYLPVYEILNTLRMYQDWNGEYLKRIETAFPAGNSAFVALREDRDALQHFLPIFQQELLRRHGVDVNDFFENDVFIAQLLPTLRPDMAVLLQENLFNTDIDQVMQQISGRVADEWRVELEKLLQLPNQIGHWRSIIWDVLGDSIYQWVQSFAELANALYSFTTTRALETSPAIARETKLSPALAGFLRTARADDEMRNFLIGAIDYLSTFAGGDVEIPVGIIRAMNDVERIAEIEESALPTEKQNVIRYCTIQIARLAGESG
ncbi:MAG: pyridoxal phosphate-dependent aminotransferase [Anaerolineales bacterium]|nr:pyridoxal phosphate-dependent aminotransferase [Chloroflexota bacterium]MBL6980637.1 pyridoxal phosphate-dependent aminotransferase [Anaerolineales bacterium]